MIKKLQEYINQFSYYNAAESPQWGNEGAERAEYKKKAFEDIKTWGITWEQFKDLYHNECCRGLTNDYEFTWAFPKGE